MTAINRPERRHKVSTEGGTQPRWNPNGKEIFYRNGSRMMAVEILSTGPVMTFSQPRLLFDENFEFGGGATVANYDVTRDGQRFIMVKAGPDSGRVRVVLNWLDELKQPAAAVGRTAQ